MICASINQGAYHKDLSTFNERHCWRAICQVWMHRTFCMCNKDTFVNFSKARTNQPIHWFLEGKGVGIRQRTSVWVGSATSFLGYNPRHLYVEMHLYVLKLTACLDPVTSNSWYTNFVNEGEILTHDYIFISKGGGLAYCKLYKWIWRTCHGLQMGFSCSTALLSNLCISLRTRNLRHLLNQCGWHRNRYSEIASFINWGVLS